MWLISSRQHVLNFIFLNQPSFVEDITNKVAYVLLGHGTGILTNGV